MNIQLIHGTFGATDALELLTQMIQIKIQYHEQKITPESSEEDIKARESKIKMLQNELHLLREKIKSGAQSFTIEGNISVL
ncbi:MAG: hypothetical protein JST78_09250 [Bacteroidetes bacterium]|nr:hypothetical protein [Bacteroidota bacterium]